jgi:tRNA modification GTPase
MAAAGHDTIVALSSGQGRAGVAVIRVSGPAARFISETILDKPLVPRRMTLVTVRDPGLSQVLDRCLAVLFAGPASATGEDSLELHLHGGPAIVSSVLRVVTALRSDIRLALPGEFTRRAFENGKLDLVQVEALGDVLEADSSAQLAQAQRLLGGELSRRLDDWSHRLLDLRGLVESELDFSDEGDVSDLDWVSIRTQITALKAEVEAVLAGAERGRLTREGARVVLAGAPNVGKSSLLNALAKRDVAIVTHHAGTTRDVLSTPIDLAGWPVLLIDMAGLRDSDDPVEQEGVRRACAEIERADLVLELVAPDVPPGEWPALGHIARRLRVGTKSDIGLVEGAEIHLSARTGEGLDALATRILSVLSLDIAAEPPLVARERHRVELGACASALTLAAQSVPPEIAAEGLRQAQQALGRLKGHVDVESVLDRLFASFCIGK